jgi:hypothetical protein
MNKTMQNSVIGAVIGMLIFEVAVQKTPLGAFIKA